MAQQKKGLITRLLEGKERSEEYARSTLPTNRWQLFWDIFKGNFWKLVKVNLLTLVFCIPLIIVVIMHLLMTESNSIIYPFGANLGVGYPASPNQQGLSELLSLQGNMFFYFGILLTSFITAVGLSGGMYVIRNMVWTEGIFVANDFWRGVKLNYKNALQTLLFFSGILLACGLMLSFSEFTIAISSLSKGQMVWMRISQGMSYILLTLGTMMSFWMISLGVNYQLKFFTMVKNAFFMTIGTLPQTIFFGALAVLPFILLLIGGQFFMVIAVMIILLFGVAYGLLVWLDFGQWVFDKYINPKIEGAKVGRGIFNKDGTSSVASGDSAAEKEYRRALLAEGKSRLVAHPIKPIDDSLQVYELPQSFSREDLKRLRESKQMIADDTQAYEEEHKNDARYVEYNEQFDALEKSVQEEADGKKKKKPRILRAKGENIKSDED